MRDRVTKVFGSRLNGRSFASCSGISRLGGLRTLGLFAVVVSSLLLSGCPCSVYHFAPLVRLEKGEGNGTGILELNDKESGVFLQIWVYWLDEVYAGRGEYRPQLSIVFREYSRDDSRVGSHLGFLKWREMYFQLDSVRFDPGQPRRRIWREELAQYDSVMFEGDSISLYSLSQWSYVPFGENVDWSEHFSAEKRPRVTLHLREAFANTVLAEEAEDFEGSVQGDTWKFYWKNRGPDSDVVPF